MDVISEIVDESNGRSLFCRLALLLKLEAVLNLPKPTHIIMAKHHTLRIGCSSRGVKKIATLPRSLLEHHFNDNSIVNIRS